MLFRQWQDPDSCTFTYLLSCPDTGQTVLIDPVLDTAERDLARVKQLGLELTYTLDTHVHADHLTGARRQQDRLSGHGRVAVRGHRRARGRAL